MPAPVCLMQHGLFASSPFAPTLAVDLRVLAFLEKLFVHLTPNTTAWCEALESFLDVQGYKLQSKDSLHWQFSNAYHWYTVLRIYVEDHLAAFVHSFTPPSVEQVPGSHPSNYSQSCCPLCFGAPDYQRGEPAQDDLDCIACLDASHDPKNPTNTVLIPESEVKAMESFVEKQRGLSSRQHTLAEGHQREDWVEDGMKIPTSILDECRDSFHAADEKWQKASTQFFADTGLMELLCHHDRVLWLVNMTSAGEKQQYSLVLLKHLFDNLPTTMTVGLLYKLLEDGILSRLKFGISIVYHPRKCAGFGLSDGEGCERLWSSLKMLIPTLCVFGASIDLLSFAALGQWLNKKWSFCKSKKAVALENLHALHVDMQTLQCEWVAQVESQTQPLPRQSKNKGSEQLAHILALKKTVQGYKSHINQLEQDHVNGHVTDIIDYNLQLASAQGSLSKAEKALKQKKSALEPAISKLVTTCNTLCDELSGMIRLSRAPPGAVPPLPMPSKGLFQLDDVGLGEGHSDPPKWLADEDVCKGIRLILEVYCCNEEEKRLPREQSILQEWFAVEWGCVEAALEDADQPTEELSEDGDSDEDLMSVEDLLMATEEVALVEEDYIGGENDEQFTEDEDWLEDIGDGSLLSSPLRLPEKRCRR
ncbi:hypothetical protein EV401DRAFT_2061677 [Pisolithus croceorrhizus]|nr:hypothetical protein EV401DRAFT_2061677 [Pisolithus croceorrhizus]